MRVAARYASRSAGAMSVTCCMPLWIRCATSSASFFAFSSEVNDWRMRLPSRW